VSQLDQMTQQNAALVEQSAAAAESLKDQATKLASAVAAFKLGQTSMGVTPSSQPLLHAAPKPAPTAVVTPARSAAPARTPTLAKSEPMVPAAPRMAELPAPTAPVVSAKAGADDDWETF
jgi:methyl-accepting chemotaxis protein